MDKKKKITKIASIGVGILLSVLLIIIGFRLVQGIISKASDSAPRDVVINGITQNGAKIVWSTDQESQAVVEYGTSPTALNFFAPEPSKTKTHSIDLTLLSPGTTYYFQIRIGDKKFDNAGVPWTLTTKTKNSAETENVNLTPSVSVPQTSVLPTEGILLPTSTPFPTQTLVVPNIPTATPYIVPTLSVYVCGETVCQNICQKIGTTCSTQDWMKSGCVGKVTLGTCIIITPTPTSAPTSTPVPTLTPTITPTPTPSPTITPTPSPTVTPTPRPT